MNLCLFSYADAFNVLENLGEQKTCVPFNNVLRQCLYFFFLMMISTGISNKNSLFFWAPQIKKSGVATGKKSPLFQTLQWFVLSFAPSMSTGLPHCTSKRTQHSIWAFNQSSCALTNTEPHCEKDLLKWFSF